MNLIEYINATLEDQNKGQVGSENIAYPDDNGFVLRMKIGDDDRIREIGIKDVQETRVNADLDGRNFGQDYSVINVELNDGSVVEINKRVLQQGKNITPLDIAEYQVYDRENYQVQEGFKIDVNRGGYLEGVIDPQGNTIDIKNDPNYIVAPDENFISIIRENMNKILLMQNSTIKKYNSDINYAHENKIGLDVHQGNVLIHYEEKNGIIEENIGIIDVGELEEAAFQGKLGENMALFTYANFHLGDKNDNDLQALRQQVIRKLIDVAKSEPNPNIDENFAEKELFQQALDKAGYTEEEKDGIINEISSILYRNKDIPIDNKNLNDDLGKSQGKISETDKQENAKISTKWQDREKTRALDREKTSYENLPPF